MPPPLNTPLITSILKDLGLELHSSGTSLLLCLGNNNHLWGIIFVWRAQAVIWGARPRNAPRGAGPDHL